GREERSARRSPFPGKAYTPACWGAAMARPSSCAWHQTLGRQTVERHGTHRYTPPRLTFPMRGSRDGDPVHPTTPPGRWCTMTWVEERDTRGPLLPLRGSKDTDGEVRRLLEKFEDRNNAPDILRVVANSERGEHEQIARTGGLPAEAIEAIAAVDDRTPIPLLTESQNLVITIVDSTLDAGGPGIDDELWSRARATWGD